MHPRQDVQIPPPLHPVGPPALTPRKCRGDESRTLASLARCPPIDLQASGNSGGPKWRAIFSRGLGANPRASRASFRWRAFAGYAKWNRASRTSVVCGEGRVLRDPVSHDRVAAPRLDSNRDAGRLSPPGRSPHLHHGSLNQPAGHQLRWPVVGPRGISAVPRDQDPAGAEAFADFPAGMNCL